MQMIFHLLLKTRWATPSGSCENDSLSLSGMFWLAAADYSQCPHVCATCVITGLFTHVSFVFASATPSWFYQDGVSINSSDIIHHVKKQTWPHLLLKPSSFHSTKEMLVRKGQRSATWSWPWCSRVLHWSFHQKWPAGQAAGCRGFWIYSQAGESSWSLM